MQVPLNQGDLGGAKEAETLVLSLAVRKFYYVNFYSWNWEFYWELWVT
jgi:hypothetical protein